jgi:hypothetical protein
MDVGMLKVPQPILDKAEKLNETELQIIHAHPVHGYQMLTQIAKIKNTIASVALQHQEHFDGSGYPRKIKGAPRCQNTRAWPRSSIHSPPLSPANHYRKKPAALRRDERAADARHLPL